MNQHQNIILTGFMGTGKSTVGRRLAALSGRQFMDSDVLIELEAEQTIPEIFAELGEAHFRQLEADVAQRLAQRQGLVVATGGGMMLNKESAAALGRSGTIFCLTATAAEIFARLEHESDHRPLLSVPNPREHIASLLAEREAVYGRFPQINTANKTPDQIAQEILAAL